MEDNKGELICPLCRSCDEHYFLKTRRHFRCKACNHTFSVTSGTLFASHKLPLKVYLIAIALFTNVIKSISALQFSGGLDVQYKTTWVLSHKIRESLMLNQDDEKLSGVFEIDGVYVGNYLRPIFAKIGLITFFATISGVCLKIYFQYKRLSQEYRQKSLLAKNLLTGHDVLKPYIGDKIDTAFILPTIEKMLEDPLSKVYSKQDSHENTLGLAEKVLELTKKGKS